MFVSHAQNFEDVILWRALKHVAKGFYIDIGAQDPKIDSVSYAFYERGWRGIHVEPSAAYAASIKRERPDELVIEAAVGEEAGEVTLFEMPGTGLSTADKTIAARQMAAGRSVQTVRTMSIRLSDLLEPHKDREIHWLKIDVEGAEKSVIRSWKTSTVRPWVIVVEYVDPISQDDVSDEWEGDLGSLGYELVYTDGLNKFYLSQAHPELRTHFGPGPNVFDGFTLSGTQSALFSFHLSEKIEQQTLRLTGLAKQLEETVAALDRSRQEHVAREAEITAQLEETVAELDRTRQEHAAREADLTTQLEKQSATSDSLRRGYAEREVNLTAKLSEQTNALATLTHEMTALRSAQTTTTESVRQEHAVRETYLTERLADDQREIARLHQVISYQNEWGRASVAHVGMLTNELSAFYQSTSWRITRPLRLVSSSISFITGRIRRLPAAVIRRSAALVRSKAPKLYGRVAVNRLARRFYTAASLPTVGGQHSIIQSKEPLAPTVSRTTASEDNFSPTSQHPDSQLSTALVSLTRAMRSWNLGKRLDA